MPFFPIYISIFPQSSLMSFLEPDLSLKSKRLPKKKKITRKEPNIILISDGKYYLFSTVFVIPYLMQLPTKIYFTSTLHRSSPKKVGTLSMFRRFQFGKGCDA